MQLLKCAQDGHLLRSEGGQSGRPQGAVYTHIQDEAGCSGTKSEFQVLRQASSGGGFPSAPRTLKMRVILSRNWLSSSTACAAFWLRGLQRELEPKSSCMCKLAEIYARDPVPDLAVLQHSLRSVLAHRPAARNGAKKAPECQLPEIELRVILFGNGLSSRHSLRSELAQTLSKWRAKCSCM